MTWYWFFFHCFVQKQPEVPPKKHDKERIPGGGEGKEGKKGKEGKEGIPSKEGAPCNDKVEVDEDVIVSILYPIILVCFVFN